MSGELAAFRLGHRWVATLTLPEATADKSPDKIGEVNQEITSRFLAEILNNRYGPVVHDFEVSHADCAGDTYAIMRNDDGVFAVSHGESVVKDDMFTLNVRVWEVVQE